MSTTTRSLLLLALVACGTSTDAPTDDDTDDTVDDTDDTDAAAETDTTDDSDDAVEAPTVVSLTPADGAVRVLPDTPIVVTFSRAMDTASVEAALTLEGLTDDASLLWNDDATVLTVVPDGGLPVLSARAGGSGKLVEVTIAGSAVDAAGVGLDAGASSAFRVVRRLPYEPELVASLTGRVTSEGGSSTSTIWAGDNEAGVVQQGLLTFDVGETPSFVAVEAATLSLESDAVVGGPWRFMSLVVDRVSFAVLDGDAYDGTAFGAGVTVPPFDADEVVEVDVTDHAAVVLADPASADDRLQLRLAFDDGTDGDEASDYVAITKADGTPALEVSLLVE